MYDDTLSVIPVYKPEYGKYVHRLYGEIKTLRLESLVSNHPSHKSPPQLVSSIVKTDNKRFNGELFSSHLSPPTYCTTASSQYIISHYRLLPVIIAQIDIKY